MKKKILAVALAAVMAITSAVSVFALETELDCTGWWAAHTEGVEITADGVEVSFTTTTYDTATANWNTPIYVVYTGDEAVVNGAGYVEYFVARSDLYGWSPAANTFDGLGDGWSWETANAPADDAAWATWLAENKAGVSGTLKATKGDGNVTVEFTVNGITSTAVIPVSADTVYVSLSGELCTLTDIKVVADNNETPSTDDPADETPADETPADETPATTPNTGDVTAVAGIAIVALAAAAAVVVLRKKAVTE